MLELVTIKLDGLKKNSELTSLMLKDTMFLIVSWLL